MNDGATPTTIFLVSDITAGKYMDIGYTGYDNGGNWYAVKRKIAKTGDKQFYFYNTNGTGAYDAYAKVSQVIGMK